MGRHWAINGRFLTQPVTGVQRYASQIVRGLDGLLASGRHEGDLEVELLVPPGTDVFLPLSAIGVRSIGRFGGHAWEQAVLPANVRGGLLSLCNTGPVALRKQIVCIHDANTRNFPQSYSPAFRALYRGLAPTLGRVAERVSTVSHYSAQELQRHGICRLDKIFVAPNGHEHALQWKPEHSPATRMLAGRDTIVVMGSSAPHKNLELIVGMADELAACGFDVAVVGMADPRVFNGSVARKAAANLHWLGRLSDEEIAALLQDCLCLAFPSFEEGFGLPPLEAMALGCPVVVSDRASLPEICSDAALYAAPDNADAWLAHFIRLRASPALRSAMIATGTTRASRYSWRTSAEIYLAAMARSDGVLPEHADRAPEAVT
ncbi:glycosyltransferase family 1 protein [Mesorhizobium sp. KR2-14]|uniref:glycosyltransferase family 4 protein n=1 Tax=Mesorhizobium sp. KR2-14 TaxID=3156610 RepID=UPI0032B52F09